MLHIAIIMSIFAWLLVSLYFHVSFTQLVLYEMIGSVPPHRIVLLSCAHCSKHFSVFPSFFETSLTNNQNGAFPSVYALWSFAA
jgi:hypothetical protein